MTAISLKPNQGIPTALMWMLAVMAGISVANLYYCQPLLNMIRGDMGLTEFQVNLVPVFTQVGYALGLLLIIPLGDMYNRRTTVLMSFCALVVSLLSISLAANAWVLLGASFMTGFCSVTPQVFMPFASLYSRPEEKERKVGVILTGLLIGILGSRVVSGYVGHLFGWRMMYVIASVLIALSALAMFKWFPNVEPTYKGRFLSLMASIRRLAVERPRSLLYSIRAAFAFGSFLGLWGCLAFRMKEAPYFEGSDVVGLLGLCGMAGALTASNVGKYVAKYGPDRINAFGLCLQLFAWGLFAVWDDSYVGLVLGILIIDVGMQCIQLSNQSATMKLCPEASARMNTIYMVTYFIGGSFGTFLAGTLWSLQGWNGTVATGLLMIAGSIASIVVYKILRELRHG